MLTTSARLLRLLSHLQSPGVHTGRDLAARLGVSARTVRNDMAGLRELGYPVQAAPGVAGGYRLGAGTRLPPLLLDDDEAVAIALGLTITADTAVRDVQDPAVRALGKVMTMLPARLRARLRTLTRATSSVPGRVVPVPGAVLQDLAAAVQTGVRIRFTYRDARDAGSHREVEPYRLVLTAGRWYLVGWDPDRDDWRSFRIDRMTLKTPPGRPFTARPEPAGGFDAYLTRSLAGATWPDRHRIRLRAPAERMRARAPVAVEIVADGPDACIATVGASGSAMLARYLSWWEADFEILDSPELLAEVRELARRYTAAARDLTGPPGRPPDR